jgi:hypothetical protein
MREDSTSVESGKDRFTHDIFTSPSRTRINYNNKSTNLNYLKSSSMMVMPNETVMSNSPQNVAVQNNETAQTTTIINNNMPSDKITTFINPTPASINKEKSKRKSILREINIKKVADLSPRKQIMYSAYVKLKKKLQRTRKIKKSCNRIA